MLLGAVSFFAFIGGLYVAFSYQHQLQFFGQGGLLIAISTLIGLAVSLSKFLFDWAREPALESGEISTNDEPAYYLRIMKK